MPEPSVREPHSKVIDAANGSILVVDDDPQVLTSLNSLLDLAGYPVSQARSGAEALNILKSVEIDAVLLDIRLSDNSGLNLLETILGQWDLPVIMMTGYATVDIAGSTNGTTQNFRVRSKMGFAHGPMSASSTLASGSAASPALIQFVAPAQTTTNITSTSSKRISNPNVYKFLLVPEPGMMLLIVSGAAGLVVLGRRRMKK